MMARREAMTDEEINRLLEENKKATAHLIQAIDRMPPVNCVPCWLELLLLGEPTVTLERYKLNAK